MAKLVKGLMFLYSMALLSSIAVMEMVSILLTLVALIFFLKSSFKDDFHLQWQSSAFDKSLLAFNAVLLFSLVFSPVEHLNMAHGLSMLKITTWYFALKFLFLKFFNIEDIKTFAPYWCGMVVILSSYTCIQFFFGIDLIRGEGSILPFGPFFRPKGFFSMSLTLAYVLGLAGIVLMPMMISWDKSRKTQPLYVLAFALSSIAMILSLSRGLWLGLVISGSVCLILLKSKKLTIQTLSFVLPLLVILGFNPTIQEKIRLLGDPGSANYYRLTLWQAYGRMFLDHWILGVGWLQNEAFLQKYLDLIGQGDFSFRSHAHSNYFQILSSVGTLGFLTYLAMMYYGFKQSFRIYKLNGFFSTLGVAFICSQLIFHIGGLTECNLTDGEVTHMIFTQWALLGVVNQWSSDV